MVQSHNLDSLMETLHFAAVKHTADSARFQGEVGGKQVNVHLQFAADDPMLRIYITAPNLQTQARISKRQADTETAIDMQAVASSADLDGYFYFGTSPDWLIETLHHETVTHLLRQATAATDVLQAPLVILEPGYLIGEANLMGKPSSEGMQAYFEALVALTKAIEALPADYVPVKRSVVDKLKEKVSRG